MRRSWVPVVLVVFGCGGQTEQGEGGTGGTVVFTGGSGGTGGTGATGGAITGGIGGIGGTGPGGAGGTAGGPCVQVGGKCDYFKPNCCGPLHCSLVGICSETSSCSGEGQPCGTGCCGGLACSPTGMCVVGPTPTCPPGTTTCTSCLSSQCCPQLSACQASPSCAKAYYCLAECEKTTDLPTCVSMCDTGAPELKPLAVCGFTNCSAACQ